MKLVPEELHIWDTTILVPEELYALNITILVLEELYTLDTIVLVPEELIMLFASGKYFTWLTWGEIIEIHIWVILDGVSLLLFP